jgi:hypothetical protein
VSEDVSINANVGGGTVGVAGAQEVRIGSQTFISNFYSAAPQAEIAKPTSPIPPCPYPGLAYFGPDDASRFFGREQAIQALLLAVAKRSFIALVGASGSGKSSVVLAGLAPRLETQGGWLSTYFRIGTEPDKNPFAALARALSPVLGDDDVVDRMRRAQKLASSLAIGDISLPYIVGQCRAANPRKRILLIADQFEEAFTLISDHALRNRFIDALIGAFPDPSGGATPDVCLVLTLRADFVGQAISDRALADKLKDRVEFLGPMTRSELHDAIVKPAEAVSIEFEPGLVDTVLDDVEKRPGSLPLLQFALREMWGRLEKPLLTRADYDAIGGVEGALAKRAQAIFDTTTQKGSDDAAVALFRRLFTRLVTLGEGSEDTRRIVGRDELGPDTWALAQKLADEENRLVVTAAPMAGRETVEVVHEALIRGWPTLVEWINQDRSFQSWLRQLKLRVEDWRANPSDEGTLLRGGLLEAAQNWVDRRGSEFSDYEKAFVAASVGALRAERLPLLIRLLSTIVGVIIAPIILLYMAVYGAFDSETSASRRLLSMAQVLFFSDSYVRGPALLIVVFIVGVSTVVFLRVAFTITSTVKAFSAVRTIYRTFLLCLTLFLAGFVVIRFGMKFDSVNFGLLFTFYSFSVLQLLLLTSLLLLRRSIFFYDFVLGMLFVTVFSLYLYVQNSFGVCGAIFGDNCVDFRLDAVAWSFFLIPSMAIVALSIAAPLRRLKMLSGAQHKHNSLRIEATTWRRRNVHGG